MKNNTHDTRIIDLGPDHVLSESEFFNPSLVVVYLCDVKLAITKYNASVLLEDHSTGTAVAEISNRKKVVELLLSYPELTTLKKDFWNFYSIDMEEKYIDMIDNYHIFLKKIEEEVHHLHRLGAKHLYQYQQKTTSGRIKQLLERLRRRGKIDDFDE